MALIDMSLLPMKAHYFLFNAGMAPIVPFIPTYAKQLGFSSIMVGSIFTVLPMMGMLAKPSVGAIADKFRCQKPLFVSFLIVTAATFFCLNWVPPLPADSKAEFHCGRGVSMIRICSDTPLGDCVAAHIIAEGGTNNSVITCKMTCEGNQSFVESVCSDWGIGRYCATRQPAVNHVLRLVEKNDGEFAAKQVLKTTPRPIAPQAPQMLKFDVRLRPWHTDQFGSCLLVRVADVYFSGEEGSSIAQCSSLQVAPCHMQCASSAISEVAARPQLPDSEVIKLYQLWLFFLLVLLSWVGMAVITSIGDAICFELLGDYPSEYGNQRLWGSVGWGVFSIVAGLLVDKFSQGDSNKDYTPVFYLALVMLSLDLLVSSRLKYNQTKRSPSILRDVGKLFKDLRIVVFMMWCVVVGMCTAMVWNFLFWHLEDLAKEKGCDTQNWIKTLEGLLMGIQCFGGELPFFFLSGWILRKIGHVHAMSIVLFAFGVRFLLYSLLVDPWWCLPIELLNGLTFGLFYSTMASYASIVAPPGTEATIQGLVGAIFEGVGVSLGSFLGGQMLSRMKGAEVFRNFGVFALCTCILHVVLQHCIARRQQFNVANNKDFNQSARYASPNDAIHMLDDQQDILVS